jgi:ketosteroid isomerase-like protein
VATDYEQMLERARLAYNARDPEAWIELWSPTCEWHPFLTARVEGDPGYHGHNGMRAWFEDVDEMFTHMHVTYDEIREVKGRLLVLGRMTAKARGSGAQVDSEAAWVVEAKGERFQRGWAYSSRKEAEQEAEALAPTSPSS